MILLPAAMILGLLPVCRAQQAPTVRFDENEWDFGTIREQDGRVTHRFGFVNTGSVPVVIERVEVTCGCTVPTFSHDPVKPGERGVVNVSFDPAGHSGRIYKSITVFSARQRHYLSVTGNVTPHPKSVEELYPWKMAAGVRFDKISALFRQVAQGSSASMVVKYVNTSDRSVSLEFRRQAGSGLLEIQAPERLCAGCEGEITLTYNLIGKTGYYGVVSDRVEVVVDGTVSADTFSASMIGVDGFRGVSLDDSPRAALSAQYRNFGVIRKRSVPYTGRCVLRNEGSQMLVVRDVSEKPGLKTTLRNGMTVAPGTELHFEVLLYSDRLPDGNLSESIVMIFNDPLRPVRELRVTAEIK